VSEVNKVTKFDDTSVIDKHDPIPRDCMNFYRQVDPYPNPDLESFFSRAYPVYNGVWKLTDTGMIKYLSFPSVLFKIDTLYSKLLNFRFITADIELTVRVNGTSFHYGKLMFSACPQFMNGLSQYNFNKPHAYMSVYNASSNHHLLVGPTENVVQKLIIPYTLPKMIDLYSLSTATTADKEDLSSEIAGVRVFVLNPLRGSDGCSDVAYTVFARFLNVNVSGYAAGNSRLYSSVPHPYVDYSSLPFKFEGCIPDLKLFSTFIKTATFSAQSAPAIEAKDKGEKNIVSSLIEVGISKVASLVSNYINTTFVSFPKPQDVKGTMPMYVKYPNLSIGHGVNEGSMLGVKEDNSLLPCSCLMGSSPDDVSIAKYVNFYSLLAVYKITDKLTSGSLIADIPVWPLDCPYSTVDSKTEDMACLYHTRLSYISSMFSLFRGSITYKFQFIASNFHNFRVRIAWVPQRETVTMPNIIDQSNFINRIVDIRTESEVEITIPYLRDSPYLMLNYRNFMGELLVTVINEVSYPQKVVPDIEMNVWVKGSLDNQFAKPLVYRSGMDTYNKVDTVMYGLARTPAAHFVTEIDDDEFKKIPIPTKNKSLPSDFVSKKKNLHAQSSIIPCNSISILGFTTGEEIVSFKELSNRPGYIGSINPGTKGDITEFDTFVLDPHFIVPDCDSAKSDKDFYGYISNNVSFMYLIRRIFRYWRGAVNYKLISVGGASNPPLNAFCLMSDLQLNTIKKSFYRYKSTGTAYPFLWLGNNGTCFSASNSQFPQFSIPYYSDVPFFPHVESASFETNSLENGSIGAFNIPTGTTFKPGDYIFSVFGSTGDDYEYGYSMGPPACIIDKYIYSSPEDYNFSASFYNNRWPKA